MPVQRLSSLTKFFAAGRTRTMAAGEILFRQGDRVEYLYLITSGRLRMLRHSGSGSAIQIHTGRPGELFAEAALFSDTYQCDAVAAGATTVQARTKASAVAALAASQGLSAEMLHQVVQQLHAARMLLERRQIRPAAQRVFQHLALQGDATGEVTLVHPLRETAEALALTPEAFYRAMTALVRAGAITRHGCRIRLLVHELSARQGPGP